uniref:Putative ovule protein n=1 Tax=Solanum chacoense TaxID=4108 RepID=A0A0V0GVG6_SOLCH
MLRATCGPDDFTGCFYQNYWSVVEAYVVKMVYAFFQGSTLPKSITHTNMVLLPKKNIIQSFSELRPIRLSNLLNKVIYRLLHDKLDSLLPRLISPHQFGFVKGRNITEKEIISYTRKRGKPANVVIKLVMAKVYDKVDWRFLMKVLEKDGFPCEFVGYGLEISGK